MPGDKLTILQANWATFENKTLVRTRCAIARGDLIGKEESFSVSMEWIPNGTQVFKQLVVVVVVEYLKAQTTRRIIGRQLKRNASGSSSRRHLVVREANRGRLVVTSNWFVSQPLIRLPEREFPKTEPPPNRHSTKRHAKSRQSNVTVVHKSLFSKSIRFDSNWNQYWNHSKKWEKEKKKSRSLCLIGIE